MSENSKMLVEIFGGVNASSCGWGGGCEVGSVGVNLENRVNDYAQKLAGEFSTVKIRYIDTTIEGLDKYPELERITAMGYSFPITAVNGEARLAGDVLYDDLKAIIKEELDI